MNEPYPLSQARWQNSLFLNCINFVILVVTYQLAHNTVNRKNATKVIFIKYSFFLLLTITDLYVCVCVYIYILQLLQKKFCTRKHLGASLIITYINFVYNKLFKAKNSKAYIIHSRRTSLSLFFLL